MIGVWRYLGRVFPIQEHHTEVKKNRKEILPPSNRTAQKWCDRYDTVRGPLRPHPITIQDLRFLERHIAHLEHERDAQRQLIHPLAIAKPHAGPIPTRRSSRAHAAIVAPVVTTSSTMTI